MLAKIVGTAPLSTLFWQTNIVIIFIRFYLFFFVAASLPSYAQLVAPGTERDRLTYAELIEEETTMEEPSHNGYFMPVGRGKAAPAKHDLSGTLVISETSGWPFGTFPGVRVKIFRSGSQLLPVTRDIIRADNPGRWNLIFSPGRVWSEPGDKGLSRASFPFVLASRSKNKAHNGLATFLFNERMVSSLFFQFSSKFQGRDAWGRLPISMLRGDIEDRDRIHTEYMREIEQRLPTRPLVELATEFGSQGQKALHDWPSPENESISGLLINGALYVGDCQTRFGTFPYCDEMRHSVYSMTKSLGALVAILRLSQKYGDQVFDLKIKDYVNVSAAHNGWDEVTFADALNMTTGIGDASVNSTMVLEDGFPPYGSFMAQPSAMKKLSVAFTSDDYPWGPGEVFRYRSIDTFILAVAMDNFLKSREGSDANIWNMVLDEVLRPIGIIHAPMVHTIELDGGRGVPIFGEGIFPTYQDVAKITQLLQNGGQYRGEQLLSASKLREALYYTKIRGKSGPSDSRFAAISYHMSLWHVMIELEKCTINIPMMSGHLGNKAALLPSGTMVFYLRNIKGPNNVDELVLAANSLRPECQ